MTIKSKFKKILIETIATSFDPKLINHLGREIESSFDIQEISGLPFGISIQPLDAARMIVEYFLKRDMQKYLITELLNSAYYGLNGRKISMPSLNTIIKELEKIGYRYDKNKRLIIKNSDTHANDWGFLEENKEYSFCFASIDVVKNSLITRRQKSNKVSSVYRVLNNLIQNKVIQRDGRVWTWEGDGGIATFHGENSVARTTLAMLDSLLSMPIFNAINNTLSHEIKIRIAIHAGKAVYKKDISTIKSEALKTVQELEKDYTPANSICISTASWRRLNTKLQSLFGKEEPSKTIGFHLLNLSVGRKPNE